MAYLAVALLGIAAWRNIAIELLPGTELPRLTIRADWRGASPEATEAMLTSPLEAAVQQVRGVQKVASLSEEDQGRGVAQITAEFTRETDMDFARLELSERLAALADELPAGVSGPYIQPYVPEEFQEQYRPFLSYTVTGPYTLEALRSHIDEVIAPALRQLDGVADVDVLGGRERIIEIELDEAKILALGLRVPQIAERIEEMEYVREAGAVFGPGGERRTLAIRHRAGSVTELVRLPVLTGAGSVVRLGDVARLYDTFEEPREYYRIDANPAVSFVVRREIGGNSVEIADRVKAQLAALAPTNPAGVRLIIDDDESEAIRAQLSDLTFRALLAGIVIFLVLLLFLQSFRSTLIVFATIAFAILTTVNLLYWGGFTLNVLTLMGLAMGFGLIVDNAIVVLENVYRRRRLGEPAELAAEQGARDVVLPVLAATLTTVVVLIPFVYLQGELRVYYVPLALVVGFALLASLLVAFTFIPALAARLLRGGGEGGRGGTPRVPLYVRVYSGLLRSTLRYPWVTVAVAVLALGGSYYLFDKWVQRGVIWGRWGWGDETYISVQIRQPRGAELERTDALARFFEAKLGAMPEVERFVTQVRPLFATIRVTFPDSLELTAVPYVIKEQMFAYSHLFGGAEVRVYGYGPSFYGGGGSPPNYAIKILGYNYERVRDIAEGLGRQLTRFSRIRDVDTNSAGAWYNRDPATELVLRVDRRRLAVHGLSARDVVRHVAAAVGGRAREDYLRIGGEEVLYAVKLEGNRVLDLQALGEVLVPTAAGRAVRLGNVARVEERPVLNQIVREDQQYQRRVSYEFRGPARLGDRVHEAVIEATSLPPGYRIEKDERWTWSEEERAQIYGVLAVALALVFMVTAALFESLRQPLCVLLTVPMALIGVFLTFFYTGASFTREAYVGVIMMGGIVVNNAILLVDHINQLRRNDRLVLQDAVLRGTIERVRPILMTSATTILGLLPLVLFAESADANIWNALGYALIGGLTSSTVLVLTVTPALYLLFERHAEAAQRSAGRRSPPAPVPVSAEA